MRAPIDSQSKSDAKRDTTETSTDLSPHVHASDKALNGQNVSSILGVLEHNGNSSKCDNLISCDNSQNTIVTHLRRGQIRRRLRWCPGKQYTQIDAVILDRDRGAHTSRRDAQRARVGSFRRNFRGAAPRLTNLELYTATPSGHKQPHTRASSRPRHQFTAATSHACVQLRFNAHAHACRLTAHDQGR